MSCFNVIFTILPPLAIGVFDQFSSARLLDKYPQMYMLGQNNEFFNQKRFWGWIANAIYHSLVSITTIKTPLKPFGILSKQMVTDPFLCRNAGFPER